MCFKSPLFALQNVEVVICRVTACVAFCAERCAEYDEVLGYGGVDEVHGAHSATGVVEEPFVCVRANLSGSIPDGVCRWRGMVRERVDGDRVGAMGFTESRHNMMSYAGCRVGVESHGFFGQLVELWWVEDVPLVLVARLVGLPGKWYMRSVYFDAIGP
jgi:hypothetical protein